MKLKYGFFALLIACVFLFIICDFLNADDNKNNENETDTAYEEIIALAKRICDEVEYDWTTRESYTGATPIQTPGKRLRQCNGFSIEMMERAIKLESVQSVQHWRATPDSGAPGNHSWNIIKLVDGRILYCDVTAFATNRINSETGEVYHAADYLWHKITFDEVEFKTRSPNTSYYPHGFLLEEARAPGKMAGNGTAGNPYIITRTEQLAAISLWVRAMDPTLRDAYNAAHYRLGNNINLSEYAPNTPLAYVPIGTNSRSFFGVFDGNGKVISGLSITPNNPASYDWGLFGVVRGGRIKNLGIEGIVINGGAQVGGIAGSLNESAVISNCYTTGEITAGGNNIGGIAGWIREGSIVENCYSTVDIKGIGSRVGGLVGNIVGTESTVRNSAALNPSIIGNTNVERVYGMWSAGSTRPNNIAFSNMLGTGFRNMTLAGCGGLDFSAAQIGADGTLGGRFTTANGWTIENGKLPGFGTARPLPDYIK